MFCSEYNSKRLFRVIFLNPFQQIRKLLQGRNETQVRRIVIKILKVTKYKKKLLILFLLLFLSVKVGLTHGMYCFSINFLKVQRLKLRPAFHIKLQHVFLLNQILSQDQNFLY